jgi:SAM-dependent methyltransferase
MAWFHTFFDSDYAAILMARRPADVTRIEVDALERALALAPGAHLCDMPCGTGRHAREFARRGYRVTGVDLSSAMLVEAAPHRRVTYRQADMRAFTEREAYDAIFHSSSGYFSDHGNLDVIRRMGRALKPGGRLALWTFSTAERARQPKGRTWNRWGDRYVMQEHTYDAATQVFAATWLVWRTGRMAPNVRRVRVRGYSIPQWRDLIRQAGLRVHEIGPKPTSDGDGGGLQIVAVKPG